MGGFGRMTGESGGAGGALDGKRLTGGVEGEEESVPGASGAGLLGEFIGTEAIQSLFFLLL